MSSWAAEIDPTEDLFHIMLQDLGSISYYVSGFFLKIITWKTTFFHNSFFE